MTTQPKFTKGPWRWEFNEKHRKLTLVGGRPKYDLTIMEFCRWGMWGAGVSMRDTRPEAEGFNLMYKVHDRPDWIAPFPGRAHHKDWCASVIHPDMQLMQAAPDLYEALDAADTQMQMAYECVDAGRYDEALLHLGAMSRIRRSALSKARGEVK